MCILSQITMFCEGVLYLGRYVYVPWVELETVTICSVTSVF